MPQIKTFKATLDDDSSGLEAHERAYRRRVLAAQMLEGAALKAGGDRVYGHGLGLAKVAGAALGGWLEGQAHDREEREEAEAAELGAGVLGKAYGGSDSADIPASSPLAAVRESRGDPNERGEGGGPAGRAIAATESGGRYDAVGPTHKKLGRALGKYQVMEANVAPWSQAAIGRAVSADEFLRNPEIQDKVFRHRFGQYQRKYGDEGAARAWFAGEGGMHDDNRRDSLGTTVKEYAAKFNRNMGRGGDVEATGGVRGSGGTTQLAGGDGSSSGFSREDFEKLYRNPRTRPYAMQILNMHLQERQLTRQQQLELAKEQRTQAHELNKQSIDRGPLPEARVEQDIRKAQAGRAVTQNNIDMKGEGAESKARGEGLAKRLNEIVADGDTAQADALTIRRMNELLSNAQPGAKTAILEEIRRNTGIALDANTDNVQAASAIINYMIPRMKVPGAGTTSDRDMASFQAALPSLLGTPGGNQIITETLGSMVQHRAQRGEIALQWQLGEISAKEAEARMKQLGDPLEVWRQYQAKTAQAAPASAPGAKKGPPVGTIMDNHRFLGGDPSNPASWEPVR